MTEHLYACDRWHINLEKDYCRECGEPTESYAAERTMPFRIEHVTA